MRFIFSDKKLRSLYYDQAGTSQHPPGVVDAFDEVMASIAAAANENDLRQLKSLHFERLKGERGNRGERSLRLNKQFRLIVTVESDEQGRYLRILGIEDYH